MSNRATAIADNVTGSISTSTTLTLRSAADFLVFFSEGRSFIALPHCDISNNHYRIIIG
ncbi:MAG: hypothetical protein HC942_21545 [Microcoleus sp. SU_5_6]|nr:hypothetical protein [Microcoleus sp. SU_5_6]